MTLYTRSDLFAVRQRVVPILGDDVIECVRRLGLYAAIEAAVQAVAPRPVPVAR